jgi:hypothetical protein
VRTFQTFSGLYNALRCIASKPIFPNLNQSQGSSFPEKGGNAAGVYYPIFLEGGNIESEAIPLE